MKFFLIRVYQLLSRYFSCTFKHVELGSRVVFHGYVAIKSRTGDIKIGNGVSLNSCRWSNPLNTGKAASLYAGPGGKIVIHDGVGISGSQIISHSSVEIGKQTLIGAGCLICDSDMHEVPLYSDEEIVSKPIKIGERVFLGARCIVLKGVTIGNGTVVGAGSVVVKDLPAGVLVAGNPARVIKELA